ncbi:hypothetical protein [Rodentibacter myodis]|uniref:Uncharacterized protein n=1 Tax=Rodentibacter myodis TaxID=1907939 RepID=A0A1V3JP20_9PAST|nr:hypothetical protein [Rodentibacter myodis]OOF58570.1 hypothetical protein BKL49_06580 [Rodentibacter myodis]
MKPYLKTLILFPLMLQVLATALFGFLDADLSPMPFSRYVVTAFFLATIPAFLIALIATRFGYVRHNIAAIVLCSSLVAFCYCNIAAYFYLLVMSEETPSFWQWITEGGLSLGLLSVCGMVFYSLFVIPWLLPKEKSSSPDC